MSEDSSPVRQHYEQQNLPAEMAERILARGRMLAKRRRRIVALGWSMAAVVALCLGATLWRVTPAETPGTLITTADVQHAISHYFAFPERPLSRRDSNPVSLQKWLETKHAPADFALPGSLKKAQSIGCRVLNVHGRQVSLICFYADSVQPNVASTGGRATYSALGRAWTFVFGPPRPMIHLVTASRSDFKDPPAPGGLVRAESIDGWRFVTWTVGEKVFVAASDHPDVAIEQIVSAI